MTKAEAKKARRRGGNKVIWTPERRAQSWARIVAQDARTEVWKAIRAMKLPFDGHDVLQARALGRLQRELDERLLPEVYDAVFHAVVGSKAFRSKLAQKHIAALAESQPMGSA